jgi:hypothetical protein
MFSKRALACIVLTVTFNATTIVAFTPAALRFVGASTPATTTKCDATKSADFCVGVLGDLHIDPRKMEDYYTGRSHWLPIFNEAKEQHGNVAVVSLGDLGESKSVRPEETQELFAGTTECHELAAELLNSFGVPYELVGGNHGTYSSYFCCYVDSAATLRLCGTKIDLTWQFLYLCEFENCYYALHRFGRY